MNSKIALMLCTQARGGMRSVIEAYQRDGVIERWRFKCLWTHRDGNIILKLYMAGSAYLRMLVLLLLRRVSFLHVHAAMRGSFWRKALFCQTARFFGVPVLLHLHGSEMAQFYRKLSHSKQSLVRRTLENTDAVIVLSESWREFVSRVAPKAKVLVVNNYVSIPSQKAAVINPTAPSAFHALFLGILGDRKGIFDLLDTWPTVLKEVPHARLIVGGNGEIDRAKIKAQQLGITETVVFLGWVAGEEKAALLRAADAFVLPSYNEGLPMSVLEAMACGIPTVTTNVGGIPEIIVNQENGILIEPGNKDGLAHALIRLAQDEQYRKSIGASGLERVKKKFSSVSVLPQLENIYKNLSMRHEKSAN